MARNARIECFLVISFSFGMSSVLAQETDDPFNRNAKNPFQRDALVARPAIAIDNPTMQKCFQMVRQGLQIAALKGKRVAANDATRISKAQGNGDAVKVANEKIKNLTQQIKTHQIQFDKHLRLAKFDEQGHTEFIARIDAIQQYEIESVARIERLKLQIEHLADENKKLRQQLTKFQRGN